MGYRSLEVPAIAPIHHLHTNHPPDALQTLPDTLQTPSQTPSGHPPNTLQEPLTNRLTTRPDPVDATIYLEGESKTDSRPD
ncbi:hypothetical protein SAMN05421809_3460 [Natronorubrum daqingense]|uniref:Uncharacterized protein n=1 Tax=Natronorubrum daqingense TaxID=588898 RepID=A0A1N7FSI4_9EURY|nr:hypothetical protein SAMN05421809_3460 [Natronorubrum daqingense]